MGPIIPITESGHKFKCITVDCFSGYVWSSYWGSYTNLFGQVETKNMGYASMDLVDEADFVCSCMPMHKLVHAEVRPNLGGIMAVESGQR